MLIGDLAARTGTTTRTLRYYEEQGLLEPGRTAAGYRVYGPGAVTRVRNVRDLLASGFTVENVKSFVRYLDSELPEVFAYAESCTAQYEVGARRVAELQERIEALSRMRDTLVRRMPWLADERAARGPASAAGTAPVPHAERIRGTGSVSEASPSQA